MLITQIAQLAALRNLVKFHPLGLPGIWEGRVVRHFFEQIVKSNIRLSGWARSTLRSTLDSLECPSMVLQGILLEGQATLGGEERRRDLGTHFFKHNTYSLYPEILTKPYHTVLRLETVFSSPSPATATAKVRLDNCIDRPRGSHSLKHYNRWRCEISPVLKRFR